MKNEVKILGAALALALLSACGGGGSSSSGSSGSGGSGGSGGGVGPDFPDGSGPSPLIPDVDEPSLSIFSDTNGTISQALANGDSLFMRNVSRSTVLSTFNTPVKFAAVEAQVSVERDGNDLLVTMRGEGLNRDYTARFPDAALRGNNPEYTVAIPNSSLKMTIHTRGDGTIADLFTTARNARRLDVIVSDDQSFSFQTLGVIGTETRNTAIDNLVLNNATATYSGTARLAVPDVNQTFDQFNTRVVGDLTMNANFGTRTISGSVNNLKVGVNIPTSVNETANLQNLPGSILLDPGTISGNSFSGNMLADGTLAANNAIVGAAATGTYSGAFYGPNAEEIGGQLTGGGTAGGNTYLGYGHFAGQ